MPTTTLRGTMLRPLTPTPDGAAIQPFRVPLDAPKAILIGRGSDADWRIPDRRVSRAHAELIRRGHDWFISDRRSQHGTFLNGGRLEPGETLPLRSGDEIGFGPCICRWEVEGQQPTSKVQHTAILAGDGSSTKNDTRISTVHRAALDGLNQQRTDALLSAMRRMARATTREEVAAVLIDAISRITDGARTHVIRTLDDESVEFLGIDAADLGDLPEISRSLINAARDGKSAALHDSSSPLQGVSLAALDIRSALCAPIMVDGKPNCFLYLDTRRSEANLPTDTIAFCSALADVAGMSIERVNAFRLAELREQMERDVRSARAAQALLFPPKSGAFPGCSYAFECLPGRHVAGDLFDILRTDDGRVAFWLGDVTGKGIGAGLLMAAVQTQLRTLMQRGATLIDALNETSRTLCKRSEPDKFVTLIAASWRPDEGTIQLVDAGHGSCCVVSPGQEPRQIKVNGGLPLGISDEMPYQSTTIAAEPGMRIITYSDGLIEQRNPAGKSFGYETPARLLARSTTPQRDVADLIHALRDHAMCDFADDLTIASFALE
ncbi:MAG: SpoIIE family protein phosphatase [Phycisphaerales bacterium]